MTNGLTDVSLKVKSTMMLTEEDVAEQEEDKSSIITTTTTINEPTRLTHQQRLQFKEKTAQMERKMRIYKTIWYAKWRQIYEDKNAERQANAKQIRQQVKTLLYFQI